MKAKETLLYGIISALLMGGLGVCLLFTGRPSLADSIMIMLMGGVWSGFCIYAILQGRN